MKKLIYKSTITFIIIIQTSCAKAPDPKLQLSTTSDLPTQCEGIKVRGRLSTVDFSKLFNCLNNNGALKSLAPLLLGSAEQLERSTAIYNYFFGDKLTLSEDFKKSLEIATESWESFQKRSQFLRRLLEDDLIDNLVVTLSSLDDEELKDLLFNLAYNTNLVDLLNISFKDLYHSEKISVLNSITKGFSNNSLDHFFNKWIVYETYRHENGVQVPTKLPPLFKKLAQQKAISEIQTIIQGLSPIERTFMFDFVKYQLDPKFRSSTIFKDEVHEQLITDEPKLDPKRREELNNKLADYGKYFPLTNFASLVQLLIAADRPMQTTSGNADFLLTTATLMESFYTVALSNLDIPKQILPDDPPKDLLFGPDHRASQLVAGIVNILYATREIFLLLPKENPLLFLNSQEELEKNLNEKLFGTLPDCGPGFEIEKLTQLKNAVDNEADPEKRAQLESELKNLLSTTWDLYSQITGLNETTIPSKMIKNYTKNWTDKKPLPALFQVEARRLAPPNATKPELRKSLETVVTYRKAIPFIHSLKLQLHSLIEFIHTEQTWLNGRRPVELLAKLNQSPSLTRGILELAGQVDPKQFRSNLELAFNSFVVPGILKRLTPLDEFLKRGTPMADESFLWKLAKTVKDSKDVYPLEDLFLIDSLLKAYQTSNEYFLKSSSYSPWNSLELSKRIQLLASFTAPMIQLPSKLGGIDITVDLLKVLHSSNPPFITEKGDMELVNYWRDELLFFPSILKPLDHIPSLGPTIDIFIEKCSSDKEEILQKMLSLLDRLARNIDGDILANSFHSNFSKLATIFLNDQNIAEAIISAREIPFEIELVFDLFGSKYLANQLMPLLKDRNATKSATLFLRDGLAEKEGVFRALRLFTLMLGKNT